MNELPKLTPSEIIDWVDRVETYYSVMSLRKLDVNATIKEIKEAFYSDSYTLTGIGEELMTLAKSDSWSAYESRIEDDKSDE